MVPFPACKDICDTEFTILIITGLQLISAKSA